MSNITDIYQKDFDSWNHKKKEINYSENKPPLFKERDIWWVSIGVNVGFEEDGKHDKFIRPVLVLKKFNKMLFLGVPLSTKIKENQYYFPITVKGETVSVLLSQIKVFSALRIQDKLAELDEKDYNKTLRVLREKLFSPPPVAEEEAVANANLSILSQN